MGRSKESDVHISSPSLSRRHARISVEDGVVSVEDLHSLNGTWVNGVRISHRTDVEAGDALRFGDVEVRIVQTKERTAIPPAQVWIENLSARHHNRVVAVSTSSAILGRGRTVNIAIQHPTVSRSHAAVRFDPDRLGWILEDLGSANGTFVRSIPVKHALLEDGTVFRLGDVELKFWGTHRPELKRNLGLLVLLYILLGVSVGLVVYSIVQLFFL